MKLIEVELHKTVSTRIVVAVPDEVLDLGTGAIEHRMYCRYHLYPPVAEPQLWQDEGPYSIAKMSIIKPEEVRGRTVVEDSR